MLDKLFRKKSRIQQKEEDSYTVIEEKSPYADRLIDKLERDNEELREELKEKTQQITTLTKLVDGYRERLRDKLSHQSEVETFRTITSPMEARFALEEASRDKNWMKEKKKSHNENKN